MTHLALVPVPPVAHLDGVSQHYGKTVALNNITLDIPARCMVRLIGPDGVGKSSLLSLISGARVIEHGNVMLLGLNIGKISFDEGINLLNQREARVYLQTPSAGSRARLGAKVDLKLTLDAAKVTAQSAAADKEMIKAAEELRRLDAETADSLARVRLDSLANRPVEAEPVIDDGLFPDEETAEDEFFQ